MHREDISRADNNALHF